jgi:hypothetical protein
MIIRDKIILVSIVVKRKTHLLSRCRVNVHENIVSILNCIAKCLEEGDTFYFSAFRVVILRAKKAKNRRLNTSKKI